MWVIPEDFIKASSDRWGVTLFLRKSNSPPRCETGPDGDGLKSRGRDHAVATTDLGL